MIIPKLGITQSEVAISFEIPEELMANAAHSPVMDILLEATVVLDGDEFASNVLLGKSEPLGKRLCEDAEEVILIDESVLGLSFCASGLSSVSSQKVAANVSSDANKHWVSSSSTELGILVVFMFLHSTKIF